MQREIEYLMDANNLITVVSFFLDEAFDETNFLKEFLSACENGTETINHCILAEIFINYSVSIRIYLERIEKLLMLESCSNEITGALASLKQELIDLNAETGQLERSFQPFKTCPLKENGNPEI